jgi:glycine hydroxymethyltransferase
VNKNLIPFDKKSPGVTSGLRIGAPAVTTRGMKEREMFLIATLIDEAIDAGDNLIKLNEIRNKVSALTKRFPLYPELLRE